LSAPHAIVVIAANTITVQRRDRLCIAHTGSP
jgi:hypothetical protein